MHTASKIRSIPMKIPRLNSTKFSLSINSISCDYVSYNIFIEKKDFFMLVHLSIRSQLDLLVSSPFNKSAVKQ
ncbi:hypothetical protein VCHA49P381_130092 [Vibrio chagasii]|nr:hypothetical protein VCHA49P381_130092 [Vibrio chagasii]